MKNVNARARKRLIQVGCTDGGLNSYIHGSENKLIYKDVHTGSEALDRVLSFCYSIVTHSK